jgi:hypothetical protein
MFEKLNLAAKRYAMRLALHRPAPAHIPTSGPRALALDAYTVYLWNNPDHRSFYVEKVTPMGVEGASFATRDAPALDGQALTNGDVSTAGLEIEHYFRGFIFKYVSHWDFLFKTAIQRPRFIWWWDQQTQRRFNRRRLAREDRMKVLKLFLEETVRDPEFKVGTTGLMSLLYTNRWIRHPDQDALHEYHGYVLESLNESGDIAEASYGYKLAPQALATLSVWEEDNRRHNDNRRIQTALAALTAVLALVAMFQAGATVWSELNPDPQIKLQATTRSE